MIPDDDGCQSYVNTMVMFFTLGVREVTGQHSKKSTTHFLINLGGGGGENMYERCQVDDKDDIGNGVTTKLKVLREATKLYRCLITVDKGDGYAHQKYRYL